MTKRYRVGRQALAVLDAVSFALAAGEAIAIWGPRLAGKTTLLRLAAGLEAPSEGAIRHEGVDLARVPANERARRLRAVGYAPRGWRVARGKPVLDHVALPLLADGVPLQTALAQAHQALDRLGASECAEAAVGELEQEQLTRVSIARALVRGPRLLLVDEPAQTSSPEERDELLRLLHGLRRDDERLALVIASRDTAVLSGVDGAFSIGDGRLRERTPSAGVVALTGARPGAERS